MPEPIRIGIVLGAGGLLGQSFHIGALEAIRAVTGFDARTTDTIVGTSAGAGIGTLLRYGIRSDDLAAGYSGTEPSPSAQAALALLGPPIDLSGGPTLKLRGPDRELLARMRRRIRNVPPLVAASAFIPDGRLSTEEYRDQLRRLTGETWPTRSLLVCTVRRRDGRRVVFGNGYATPVDIADAVCASSAVPGFFAPVHLHGEEYLDGALHSPTNADLLKKHPLHFVIISSPMTTPSLEGRSPKMLMRKHFRAQLNRELDALTAAGVPTAVIEPSDELSDRMQGATMDRELQGPIVSLAQEEVGGWLEEMPQRFLKQLLTRSARASAAHEPVPPLVPHVEVTERT